MPEDGAAGVGGGAWRSAQSGVQAGRAHSFTLSSEFLSKGVDSQETSRRWTGVICSRVGRWGRLGRAAEWLSRRD